MQILVFFKNEGTCVLQGLLGTIFWIMRTCFVVTFSLLIGWSIQGCKWNCYSAYVFEENQ